MACCMNSIAISRPNNSPATRVNLLMMEQAPKIDSKNNRNEVQTHTLKKQMIKQVLSNCFKENFGGKINIGFVGKKKKLTTRISYAIKQCIVNLLYK